MFLIFSEFHQEVKKTDKHGIDFEGFRNGDQEATPPSSISKNIGIAPLIIVLLTYIVNIFVKFLHLDFITELVKIKKKIKLN